MSKRVFVATRKGLFSIQRRAGNQPDWSITRVSFLGDPVTMVLPDERDGTIYAALNLGHFGVKMHRSKDGGENWEECAIPSYPKQPEAETEKAGVAWKLTQIWSLEAGGSDQPNYIWAGTIPGGLFLSKDCGDSWQLNESLWQLPERSEWFGGGADLPGIHSICVNPRNSQHITVGVSCGGVWTSLNAGEGWECRSKGMWAAYMPPERRDDPIVQDPHRVVQCRSNPDMFWAQHHNGIFRSLDAALSWQEIKDVQPSVFGFATEVHPNDPDTAWFVPAIKDERRIPVNSQLVVTRTRNGGKSFEILREGLPQQHAYDLIYRHGMSVDRTGTRLAIGSTTGGLWISEDQGDSWHCIYTHLPPIYCVRFSAIP
ncbi:MAG: exo-alpha-sialidase [Acidobacteriota bacterium]